ncbi:hypothetical protein [Endozoicomonas numazuensis]|uniref:Uncharacterized protein n=1 Tax=Endozoicomonas numazuensis TaxID=1137799 RepID=A0A081NDB0_9GAMM|nr:hypothetical protein [Endozoicomonas numazuensis]KEQ16433.1 hypothetical protein GZ78_21455 [Endozoicomonas numazuensis]
MANQQNGQEPINLTNLRKNIYAIFDEIIKTGQAVVVDRGGVNLTISLSNKGSKLDRLKSMGEQSIIIGNEEGLESESVFNWEPDNGFN